MKQRISKLMSERGIASRREADRLIEMGLVKVNGVVISELGTRVDPDAIIELLPKAQKMQSDKVTIILHKPLGIVSSQPEKGYKEALSLITPENQFDQGKALESSHLKKLAPAGRLDIDSKGLLVMSQDGTVIKKIIGPESNIEKEYLVDVEGKVTPAIINQLRFGLSLDGKALKRAKVDLINPTHLKFILTEGKKRQIRRMCELVGLKVIRLKRVRIGKLKLGKLPEGKWRFLTAQDSI